MPRTGKKALRKLNNPLLSPAAISDITINDFANSSRESASNRLKKSCIIKNLVTEVDKLDIFHGSLSGNTKLAGSKKSVNYLKRNNNHRKKKTEKTDNAYEDTGYYYPIRIWFLISEHILPEDIGRFAAICSACRDVVSTAQFWFNLYKKHYRKDVELPEILRPERLVRRYGLRAYVIRALYFMYPPFINKVKPQMTFDGDPYALTKRQCILSWSQKNKNHWYYYFKLKKSDSVKYGRGNNNDDDSDDDGSKPSLLEVLEDITANTDDNCKVLQVTCLDYVPLPMVIGQTLSNVSLTLSQGLHNHRLQLNFGSDSVKMNNELVVLDPVLNVRVLDWWHPSFPHSDGLSSIQLSNEDSTLFDDVEF